MNVRCHRWLALGASLFASFAAGCAEERAPINRVQANALDKTFFVGSLADPADDPEFYWRNFVVDGSEAQSLVGIGSWSGVDRIRWDIQEQLLVARKAYPIAPGADDKGGPGLPDGTIVAAYPIVSHFDIVREYNPTTGEELNVVVENTTDRPWYERQYMRVDWSINLVETPMWFDMFIGKVFGEIKVTPIAYYVSDPTHPDAPHFEPEKGYFDVTSKFWVEPEQLQAPFMPTGTIPACVLVGLYTGSNLDSCDPQEAVIRSSYLKVSEVDPDEDFEPFDNPHAALDIVGNPGGLGSSLFVGMLTPQRIAWDPQYGYTDAGLRRYMHIHNIWRQSHQTKGTCSTDADCADVGVGSVCLPSGACTVPCRYEDRADTDANGTDDQCENALTGYRGSEGSQCSVRNRCTIPYRDREIRTVGYWVNAETPDALLDPVNESGEVVARGATEDLVYTWNQALKLAVARAREVECRRTGGDRDACHAEFFEPGEIEMVSYGGWGIPKVKPGPDVLTTCHNPVRPYDDPLCGEVGYSARVGDLRHNFLFYWPHASRAPWGGIANWNADPLTGQIVGAAATTLGRSATMAAAQVRDILLVAAGELDMSDITDGEPARRYQKQLRDGRTPEAFSDEEIERRIRSVDAKHALSQIAPKVSGTTPEEKREALIRERAARVTLVGEATPHQRKFETLANAVNQLPVAADLVNPTWATDLAGVAPTSATALTDTLSPLAGADPGKVEGYRKLLDHRLAMRGVCFADHQVAANVGNPDLHGVARYYFQKYDDDVVRRILEDEEAPTDDESVKKRRAELIYEDLWKEAYKGIQLHEIGHSLGLLHQFTSSYDSTNYNPQYWQLRTNEGQAMRRCTSPRAADDADTCMGPRYLDPETPEELGTGAEPRPGLNYFAHTSTMEYQNERFFESVGLGQYDTFAMGALYGRVLETFDERALPVAEQVAFGLRHWSQLTEDNIVIRRFASPLGVQIVPVTVHYTEQARLMGLFDPSRCRPATDEELAKAEWRVVNGKVCAPPPKDYSHWDDFESSQVLQRDDPTSFVAMKWKVKDGPSAATPGSVRWPYRFGASDNAYVHTNPSDAGADIYEATVETIRKFEYSYPFTYFRRQRRDYYYPAIPGSTAYRFFERLRSFHWLIANGNAQLESFDAFEVAAEDDDWWRPYVMAESKIFDALARTILLPQIGPYNVEIQEVDAARAVYDTDPSATAETLFSLDASTGRYVDPDYDSSPTAGGSWEYLDWVHRTGFSFEKSLAALALTDGRPNLMTINRENYLDGRDPFINFRSDMPAAVDRLLGGLLSGDWETIAPHVTNFEAPSVELIDLAATEPTRPANATLLFPNVGYKQQLGALTFAHVFARLNTDLTLANKLRIWVAGSDGEMTIPEDQKALFYNPESGLTYVARRYGPDVIDGKTVDAGIGSRMLARANALLAGTADRPGAFEVQRDEDGAPLYNERGLPVLALDENGRPVVADSAMLGQFRKFVGLVDAAVQIARTVGYGPFNGGLPTAGDLN